MTKKRMPTANDLAVLRALLAFMDSHLYAPTFRELGKDVGKPYGSIACALKRLHFLGLIDMTPRTQRTLCPTVAGRECIREKDEETLGSR